MGSASTARQRETRTVTVSVHGDRTVELNEEFLLELSNINAQGRDVVVGKDQGVGGILNNDSAVISINDVSLAENDSGVTSFVFTVTLDAAVDTGLTVDFASQDGTATLADNDYQSRSGTLNFVGNLNETHEISVPVNGDINVESDETFFVNLFNLAAFGRSVSIADAQGHGHDH